MARLPSFDPIEYLVLARFPLLKMARAETTTLKRYMDNGPETIAAADTYRKELESLSLDEMNARVAEQKARDRDAERLKVEQAEAARWYNRPGAMADFQHWAKMSTWTVDEAVALSLGRDPRQVTWKNVAPNISISSFAAMYSDRYSIASRALMAGQLWGRTSSGIFLAWAARMGISVPPELTEAVRALGVQIADWKSLYEEAKALADTLGQHRRDALQRQAELQTEVAVLTARVEELKAPQAPSEAPLGTRERETMLKIIIGMAIDGYGYQPNAARSPIPGQLSGLLLTHGIEVSDDTIRKYLNEAKDVGSR